MSMSKYRIPCRVAVGNRSAMVLDQLDAYEASQESAQVLDSSKCEISTVFIVDRDVDYASCLLSPVTYEALLDEVFSIRWVWSQSGKGNAYDLVFET